MKNFVEKLKIIIDNEGLTASKFSEKIGVQKIKRVSYFKWKK